MSEAEKPGRLENVADQDEQSPWSSARLSVRAAGDGDERTLAKIDHSTWSWEVAPVPLWPLEKPFFDDQTLPENVLVAEDHGRVVGYVKLRPASLAYRKAATASRHVQQVHGFAVDQSCQGRGVGRLLLEAARQESVRRKARRITLRVLSTNSRLWPPERIDSRNDLKSHSTQYKPFGTSERQAALSRLWVLRCALAR